MATGIKPNDQVIEVYNQLKNKKGVRSIVFTIEEPHVVIESQSESLDYNAVVSQLPKDEPRYVVVDYEYDLGEGLRNKIVLVNWVPEKSKIKRKMLFAGTKDALKRVLQGIAIEIQATDQSELEEKIIKEKCASFK